MLPDIPILGKIAELILDKKHRLGMLKMNTCLVCPYTGYSTKKCAKYFQEVYEKMYHLLNQTRLKSSFLVTKYVMLALTLIY